MSLPSLAARLPDVQTLIAWSQSMAMLDAILGPEWDMRHFSHDAHWALGEHMASMRNGSGGRRGKADSIADTIRDVRERAIEDLPDEQLQR